MPSFFCVGDRGNQCGHLDCSDRGPKAPGCIYTAFPLPTEHVCVSAQPAALAASGSVQARLQVGVPAAKALCRYDRSLNLAEIKKENV